MSATKYENFAITINNEPSRKRQAPDSSDEEGRIATTDEEDGEIEEDTSHHKRHKSKKSKKHKKEKKHKSKKHRRSRRSETPEDDQRLTDKEGGSTPEVEAGEMFDRSDEDYDRREHSSREHSSREHSRSASLVKSRRRSPSLDEEYDRKEHSSREYSKSKSRRRSPSPDEEYDRKEHSSREHSKSASLVKSRKRSPSLDEEHDHKEQSSKEQSRAALLAKWDPKKSKKRSPSPPARKNDSDDRSRSHGISRGNSRSRSTSGDSRGKSLSPPPMQEREMKMPLKIQRSPSPQEPASKEGGSSESLSIEETNKLRASIGLPPLKINTKPKVEDVKEEKDKNLEGTAIPNSNVRHKPAENLTTKSATEKMREKLQQRKMKRMQESKLLNIATLGAADDVDDTAKWLKNQKKKEKEKKEAAKRAKMLAEMDDEFGVGNLVKEDAKKDKAAAYDSGNLAGLTVQHDSSRFQDGSSVILTLKDNDILGEEGDTLVNVNMMDDERVDKNKEEIKKAKVGYNPYDQEEIDEVTGELRTKGMLDKYDEEIDGEKKRSFVIGSQGKFSEEEEREKARAKIREKLASHTVESLQTTHSMKIATDYYTEEEASVKFKKPKKKKKVKRKMLKADDLLGLEDNNTVPQADVKQEPLERSTRTPLPMDVDELDIKPDISRIKVEDDDRDLQRALKKARRIKERARDLDNEDRAAAFLAQNGLAIKEEIDEDDHESSTGAEFINTFEDDKSKYSQITINETSEFCRNLGAWQASGGSGLVPQVAQEIRDFEDELTGRSATSSSQMHKSSRRHQESEDEDMDIENTGDSDDDSKDRQAILDDEPDLKTGMAAAIKLASNKGYWEQESRGQMSTKLKHLEAKSYTIEDKANDDRHSRRDRYGGGSTTNFQEKADYKPNVRLEYIDDDGRMLDRKEAFRYLSHKFHGKGSGKLKTEKRQKKVMEESLMKNMSSTDTPLNTLGKLRQKQKDSATPYVILTGNKVQPANLKK